MESDGYFKWLRTAINGALFKRLRLTGQAIRWEKRRTACPQASAIPIFLNRRLRQEPA
jgi:hypothetical protein